VVEDALESTQAMAIVCHRGSINARKLGNTLKASHLIAITEVSQAIAVTLQPLMKDTQSKKRAKIHLVDPHIEKIN